MPALPPRSILLAGLPTTGKSSFGNWLEAQQGYFHLDFDEEDIIAQRGFGGRHYEAEEVECWNRRSSAITSRMLYS